MSQRKDTGLNTNPWPKLVDHYRVIHNNLMRIEYTNNLLCMFELKGYEVDYNYDESTDEMDNRSKNGAKKEKKDRFKIYQTLDKLRNISQLQILESKHDDACTIDEKRIKYASDVFSFYNTDKDSEQLKKVFEFDKDGIGRKKINNLSLATYGLDSKYYTTDAKEKIFKELFKCLSLDKFLSGKFSNQDFKKFSDFVNNGQIKIAEQNTNVKSIFSSIFPKNKTASPTWIVKNMLLQEFGLKIEVVDTIRINEKKENLMQIEQESAFKLLKFYQMANPFHIEVDSIKIKGYAAELKAKEIILKTSNEIEISEANFIVQEFSRDEEDHYNVININDAANKTNEILEHQKLIKEMENSDDYKEVIEQIKNMR